MDTSHLNADAVYKEVLPDSDYKNALHVRRSACFASKRSDDKNIIKCNEHEIVDSEKGFKLRLRRFFMSVDSTVQRRTCLLAKHFTHKRTMNDHERTP